MRSAHRLRSMAPGLQRSLAAGVLALLWVSGSAWGHLLLSADLLWPLMLAPVFMLLATLLRPWSLLMRLWQPLAPRFPAMGLLWPQPLVLLQRDALVQALGWTTAACAAAGLLNWLPPRLAPRLIGGTLEGLAPALSLAAALLVSLPLGVWLQRLPRRWARARLAGQRDGAASSDALALAANLMLLLPCLLALWMPFASYFGWGGLSTESLALLLPALLAGWALHAGLRQWLAGAPPQHAALWLAVLPPEAPAVATADAASPAVATPPPEIHTQLALAHQLAGRWPLGPVTVLLPDSLPASGEHLRAAQIAGRAHALFPTLPVQLADWQQCLPPPARWAALPLRELHLPRRWMAGAAALLLQPGDRLLVLASAGAELSVWQPLLLGRAGRVLRLGEPTADADGPSVAADERNTLRLKAAALALLQPLQPHLEPAAATPATGMAGDAAAVPGPVLSATGSSAMGSAASAPPGLVLPASPSLARLAAFVALSVLLALAGYTSLLLQLNAQSDGVASRWAALRLQTAPPAAGATVGPQPASALQDLLAPEISNGLLTVSERPGQSVITLRADGVFEPGNASLTASAEPTLARVAAALGGSGAAIQVIAHGDNQPTRSLRYPSNFALSSARADTVLARLADRVERSRLSATGQADTEPVADNATPAGRAANRRIEIVVLQPTTATLPAPVASSVSPAPANNSDGRDGPVNPPADPANKATARVKKS